MFVPIQAREAKRTRSKAPQDALDAVREEDKTIDWFAVRFGKRYFAILDTFPDESGRLVHLAGKVGRVGRQDANIDRRLPTIEHAEVLAFK